MMRLIFNLFGSEKSSDTKTVSRSVKVMCLDQWYRMKSNCMAEFVLACQREIAPELMIQKNITIQPGQYRALPIHDDTNYILLSPDLSFEISRQEALTICNQILTIMRDPLMVMSLLQDLDKALEKRMREENIEIDSKDQPQYLLAGRGYYIPGPAPAGYQAKRKNKVLDRVLLEREMSHGINREGYAAKFVGIVHRYYGDAFVADGHLFTEEKQSFRVLMHGSQTHRIAFDMLCTAMKNNRVNFKAGQQKLSPRQLLELLVKSSMSDPVKYKQIISMWVVIMDNLCDELEHKYNQEQYQFLCRSPNVLNSLILCFGADLGVPRLQQCLLDSHWKAADKMILRVQDAMPLALRNSIPAARLYTYCMEYMEKHSFNSADFGAIAPFNLAHEDALRNPKYEAIGDAKDAGIVRVRNGRLC